MTEAIKVLGQSKPAATTLTDAYTVPGAAGSFAVLSTVTACEQAGAGTTIRISVAVAGAADDPKQYFAYGLALAANETRTFTLGITLSAGDVVRCYSASGSVSFGIFGAETT